MAVKLNAVDQGMGCLAPVIPGERLEDWESHLAGIIASLRPVKALEQELACRVAQLTWRLRRVQRYETGVFACSIPSMTAIAAETQQLLAKVQPSSFFHEQRRDLDHEKERLAELRREIESYQNLKTLPPDSKIEGSDAMRMIRASYDLTPGSQPALFFFRSSGFLTQLRIPAENQFNPEDWDGWTCSSVIRGMELIGARNSSTAATMIDKLIESLNREIETKTAMVRRLLRESGALALGESCSGMEARSGHELFLPVMDPATIDKIIRYEGHLSRQLVIALETLNRLQCNRNRDSNGESNEHTDSPPDSPVDSLSENRNAPDIPGIA